MDSLCLKISEYLKNVVISQESLLLKYETAGYRCEASLLTGVAARIGLYACLRSILKNGLAIGIMITASHNPHNDNGIKLVDSDGGMLPTALESGLIEFVRSTPSDISKWMHENLPEETDFDVKPKIFMGCDTRTSSAILLQEIKQSVAVIGCDCTDFGLVTTPQLHMLIQIQSEKEGIPDRSVDYIERYAHRLAACLSLLKVKGEGGNGDDVCKEVHLNVDCAHGVGSIVVTSIAAHLHLEFSSPTYPADAPRLCLTAFNTRTHEKEKLNKNCGADFVKLTSQCPEITPPGDATEAFCYGSRWASIDGDGDRLLYFFPDDSKAGGISLLDGDRISGLFSAFIAEQLRKTKDPDPMNLRLGVVQTAYANSASTRYLSQELGVEVVCTLTGVKHLHQEAKNFDFGVYFEANGHGTVVLSSKANAFVTALPSNHPLKAFVSLLNTAVGDALTDILLVEYILLQRGGLSLPQWFSCYTDLPSRQLKVVIADRFFIKTTNADRIVVSPRILQIGIDGLVSELDTLKGTPDTSRAFVRASGTENMVRVYAESSTQALADWLAVAVARLVYTHANGVDPAPALLGPMP